MDINLLIQQAKGIVEKIDKGNLEIIKVPIQKIPSPSINTALKPLIEMKSVWIVTFKRYLDESKMFYIWKFDNITEE